MILAFRDQKSRKMARSRNFDQNFSWISKLVPSLKGRSISLYLEASEVVEGGGWRFGRVDYGDIEPDSMFSNDRNQVNGLIELISRMVVVVGVMGQCCVPSQSCLQREGCAWRFWWFHLRCHCLTWFCGWPCTQGSGRHKDLKRHHICICILTCCWR
jgi:hypothetical protein